ncbi:MAG: GIY-YIG nuclease family protein [Candidatus Omnitrophica bacterium]|nr:GIY-YIG nuclease family protein [Candidatus Omnitrophota bacterium]
MNWVYVLKSKKDGDLYIGSTSDLEKRLHCHNGGKVRSTKARKPLTIVYKEQHSNVSDARKRENFLKSGQGRKLLKDLIKDS